MKVLIAIQSSKNAEDMANKTLRWAARAGFNLRVFIPDASELEEYTNAIEDANHNYYLDVPAGVVVIQQEPLDYAEGHGFDLLVLLPDDLYYWHKDTKLGDDKTVVDYAEDIGKARVAIGKDSSMQEYVFENGAKMVRV